MAKRTTISYSPRLLKILKTPLLIAEIRAEFDKKAPNKIRKAILSDINKSISPVRGQNKFVRYSESYIKAIQGELGQIWDKNVSPVNLKLSGTLHDSLKVYGQGDFAGKYSLKIEFNDFLADIHNRRGASKKKVIRRLLPTKSGERFNYGITQVILDELKRAIKVIASKFS